MYQVKSSWGAALGVLVALVALVGTQFFSWEWGSDQLAPTIIGVLVAAVAVAVLARRVLE